MIELMDIYDENKNKTGRVIERENRNLLKDNEYTLCVHCFIINSKKEILLTQRSLKMSRPSLWEDTHGGVKAGEDSISAIKRELYEELGIIVRENELQLYKSIKRKNVFRDIYLLYKDIPLKSINFLDKEVMDCKYVSIDEFKDMIKEGKCTFQRFEDTIFYNSNLLN